MNELREAEEYQLNSAQKFSGVRGYVQRIINIWLLHPELPEKVIREEIDKLIVPEDSTRKHMLGEMERIIFDAICNAHLSGQVDNLVYEKFTALRELLSGMHYDCPEDPPPVLKTRYQILVEME